MNATLTRYLAAVGLFTMSTGVTRPVFPLFAAGLGVGVVLIGVLNSVGVAANAVVRPLSGRLADRYGRIAFIRGGLLFLVAGNVAYAVAPPRLADIVLAVGSTAIGIGAAAFWPSLKATLVEQYLDRRERALGYITTTQGVCTALGAAIGGVAATGLGYRWSFALGATSLLAAAIVIGRPPQREAPAKNEAKTQAESQAETQAEKESENQAENVVRTVVETEAETAPPIRRIPMPVLIIVAATALMNIALGAILTFLSLYANQVYHQPAAVIGLLFTFVFLGQALGGYLVGMASGTAALRRFGRRRLLVTVLGLAALCCLATPLLGFIAFGAAQAALAVLATVAGIVMMALSTELMSVTALGTVIGSVEAVGLSASLLGPVLGGALFQVDRAAFFPVAGLVFAAALVLLIPAWSRLDTRDPVGDAAKS